jgi:hypothetical protein
VVDGKSLMDYENELTKRAEELIKEIARIKAEG